MKNINKFGIGVLTLGFMLSSSVAYAEESNLGGARAEVRTKAMEAREVRKADIQVRRAELKTEINTGREANKAELEAKRDELKAQLSTKRMSLISTYGVKLVAVHQSAINRLTKLADRIGSRIGKFEAEKGANLSEAKEALVSARAKIAVAQTYLDTVSAQVNTAVAGADPSVAFKSVRAMFEISLDNLKSAHQALSDVMKGIKVGLGLKDDTASSTGN